MNSYSAAIASFQRNCCYFAVKVYVVMTADDVLTVSLGQGVTWVTRGCQVR